MIVSRVIASCTIVCGLLLTLAPPAGADTEAEIAAATERSMTETEYTRLVSECRLDFAGEALDGFPPGSGATRVTLAEQRFLPLITAHLDPDNPGEDSSFISAYDPLPKGGIGRRDYCEFVTLGGIPEPGSRVTDQVIALRLRPGLDLEQDYPTAFAEMMRRGQFLRLPAADFVSIDIDAVEDQDSAVFQNAGNPLVDPDGIYIVIDDRLLMPLRE